MNINDVIVFDNNEYVILAKAYNADDLYLILNNEGLGMIFVKFDGLSLLKVEVEDIPLGALTSLNVMFKLNNKTLAKKL